MAIDWNEVNPKDITLADFETTKEEDFPNTYSGTAWRACWRMYHLGYKKDKGDFLKQDGWGNFPYLHGLDLTGFMVGWACNVLRYLLKQSPVRDGATVVVGGGDNQPVGVPLKSAEGALHDVLGGEEEE